MRVPPIRTTRVRIRFGLGRKPATATAIFFLPPLFWTTEVNALSVPVPASSPQRSKGARGVGRGKVLRAAPCHAWAYPTRSRRMEVRASEKAVDEIGKTDACQKEALRGGEPSPDRPSSRTPTHN